jgi:hypothetical protein
MTKKRRIVLLGGIGIIAIALIAILLSASLGAFAAKDELPQQWVAKFEPSGTHVQDGVIKVRMDIYPHQNSKTFNQQYVDKPIRPYTQEELDDKGLQDLVPKVKVLNPMICIFIKINADTSRNELAKYVRDNYGADTLEIVDDKVSKNHTDSLSVALKNKHGNGKKVTTPITNELSLVNELNNRFSGLEVNINK